MTGSAPQSNLTDLGLPGVRSIPYGVHMCSFYRTRSELAAALVPYFAAGLRITGNVTFLSPKDWGVFMEYEALVQRAFHNRRIVTLCTYHLETCGASEVLDVMRRHSCTLDRPDQGWQILTGQPA
jgi:hypothetical protein